jgi:hypothetical protein
MLLLRLMFLLYVTLWCFGPAQAQSPTRLGVPTSQDGIATVGDPANGPYKPLPVVEAGASFANITTNASTVIKAAPGTFTGVSVNTAGTTSNVIVYNNTTCTGAIIGTFSTVAVGMIPVNAAASVGICAKTAGGAAADITVYYR